MMIQFIVIVVVQTFFDVSAVIEEIICENIDLPFSVIFVPELAVYIMFCIFKCFIRVLMMPSPSASSLDNSSLLAWPLFSMSCSALNICATSKEIFLLGAYLSATLNKALIYMCMCYSSQSFVCHVIVERLSIYVLDKLSIHTSTSNPFVFGLPLPTPL